MEAENNMLNIILQIIPVILVIAATIFLAWLARRFFDKRPETSSKYAFVRGLIFLAIIILGIISVLMVLPIAESMRNSLLTVFGIIISATITLSSTTFVGNAMAGFMLRAMRQFRTGDFIRVENHFGRVSEQTMLHTEIQTEDSTLTTLPNLYLVKTPVTVIRASGTIISCEISLGYDISHERVQKILLNAATDADLQEPFVQIKNLGDFSITYRCAGLLPDAKHMISAESQLRIKILDRMHQNKIEIVSPTFMNQRAIAPDKSFIPSTPGRTKKTAKKVDTPEEMIFDKAEQAAQIEELRTRLEKIKKDSTELEKCLKETTDRGISLRIQEQIPRNKEEQKNLEERIQLAQDNIDEEDENK